METKAKVKLPLKQIEAFAKRWRIRELALFGSVLRQDFGPDSDIDVLVTFEPNTHHTLLDLVRMEDEMEEILGREVDLIDRKSVESSRNYIRKREVLSSLETVYVSG